MSAVGLAEATYLKIYTKEKGVAHVKCATLSFWQKSLGKLSVTTSFYLLFLLSTRIVFGELSVKLPDTEIKVSGKSEPDHPDS